MNSNSRLAGHAACFVAYAIFGFNIIVCKDLTEGQLISPIAIFTLRALGAGLLFWIISLFSPREKVDTKDFVKIFAAAFLGYFVTQLTFLVAIPNVTPMHCSIISAMSPIYTMFIAAIVLKEPLSWQKAIGVAVSLCGILFLILGVRCGLEIQHHVTDPSCHQTAADRCQRKADKCDDDQFQEQLSDNLQF